MATVKHAFTSAKSDGADATLVQPSSWNADHTITGLTTVATDAIWDAAGDLAVGSGADTASRLAIGAAGGALSVINSAVAWNSGTSFPANKATGDRFWRTDLGLECYYDGTRWLTTNVYRIDMSVADVLHNTTTAAVFLRATTADTTYDRWLVSYECTTYVNATNNGSNYYSFDLRKATAAGSYSSIATFNTSGDTVSNQTPHAAALGALLGNTNLWLDINVAKTGNPGGLRVVCAVFYRLVIT